MLTFVKKTSPLKHNSGIANIIKMSSLKARDILRSAIPDLRTERYHTTSNAIHALDYRADLRPWVNFLNDVWDHSHRTNWQSHGAVLAHRPKGHIPSHSLTTEQLWVGNEMGVLGRFNQNVGQAVSGACRAFGLDISFGD